MSGLFVNVNVYVNSSEPLGKKALAVGANSGRRQYPLRRPADLDRTHYGRVRRAVGRLELLHDAALADLPGAGDGIDLEAVPRRHVVRQEVVHDLLRGAAA